MGLQWLLRLVLLALAILAATGCKDDSAGSDPTGGSKDIVSVEVTAAATTVEAGDSVVVSAQPRAADGTTRTDVAIAWLSTDTSVAKVEARAATRCTRPHTPAWLYARVIAQRPVDRVLVVGGRAAGSQHLRHATARFLEKDHHHR